MPRMSPPPRPLADDGFRQRFALDGDRLIVRVVVVDVEGWVRQAGDEASRHQSLIKLVAHQWLLLGLPRGGLGAFSSLAGRLVRFLWLGKLAIDLLAKPPHLLW